MVRRSTTRKKGPEPLGQLLTQARSTAARRAGVALDHETWREIAGDRIAQRSAPGNLDSGVLTVVVASPVWAQELSFLADEIMERLRKRGLGVSSIRFRTGAVAKLAEQAPARRIPRPVELPADAAARLEQVEDPALRDVIATAMRQSLANQERKPQLKPKRGAPDPRCAEPGSARSDRAAARRSARPRRSPEED
ncbi:MAG: DUF721 domain-containing protein [Myxococcales bacterium]|nr:DUF721 domain-containing protein [Myxococcales bacterium]